MMLWRVATTMNNRTVDVPAAAGIDVVVDFVVAVVRPVHDTRLAVRSGAKRITWNEP